MEVKHTVLGDLRKTIPVGPYHDIICLCNTKMMMHASKVH